MDNDELQTSVDSPGLPRWLSLVAGLLLLPLALLCVIGALTMFTLPKVERSFPLLSVAVAIVLATLWVLALAVRLIAGWEGRFGLFGPWALRFIAVCAVGLTIGGLFTGYYTEKPALAFPLATSYVMLARRLWQLAAERAARFKAVAATDQ